MRKGTRILAIFLAFALLLTAVAALNYDLNSDGKTNVWDLQLAFNQNKSAEEKAAALREAFGGQGDELHPNEAGVYEIWSRVGLTNFVKNARKGYSFKLMVDLDLGGMDWTPIDNFRGNFDGNGHTISNFKVTKCGADKSMGFFSVVDHNGTDAEGTKIQSEVKNLHLVDVEITVTEEALYIGLLTGSNRGKIQNCSTVGVVNDDRTMLPANVYVGTITGRNNNSDPAGTISGSNAMDALEYYDYEPQVGTSSTTQYKAPYKVNSMMATNFATLSYPEGTESDQKFVRKTGIAGYTDTKNINTSLVWQDITNSSKFDSQILRDRRTTVTDAMYEMSTVEWTPSQTLVYYENGVEGTYGRTAGKVYRGLPYNHGGSSIYRFLAYMDVNGDGRYTTTIAVPTVGYYFTDVSYIDRINTAYKAGNATTSKGETVPLELMTGKVSSASHVGFTQYIGADCSSQTLMAWRTVSATGGVGGVTSTHTNNMFMCQEYIESKGLVPVNGFILTKPATDLDGDGNVNDHGDRSYAVREYARANKDHYMQTLACTKKGDLLMDYIDEGGHTLMAMSDAVVIRNYKGDMDLDKSYIITAEQGGSGGTRKGTTADGKSWSSTCCVDEVNSFNVLYDVKDTGNYPSIFFPITCAALREENTPAATVTITMKDGAVNSNFQIISSTVNGETVYAQIAQSNHRTAYNKLTVKSVHPNVAAGDKVEILLSNGQTYTFTY